MVKLRHSSSEKRKSTRRLNGGDSKPRFRRCQCAYCNKWFTGPATASVCPECGGQYQAIFGLVPEGNELSMEGVYA